MALSQYALSQLNVKGERDTKPSMFDFSAQSQTVPKKLSRQEVVEALKNVPDKNAGFDALLNAGYEIEGYEPQIQTLAPVKESTEGFIPTLKEGVRQLGDFGAAFGSTGVRAVTGLGSVLGDIISAPAYSDVELSGIFTGENADKGIGGFFRRGQDKIVGGWNRASGVDENSLGYKIGDFAGTAALTAPLGGLGLGSKIASAGTAGKIGYGALAGLGETAAQYTVSEGRLGTPTELAIGTGLGAGVGAIGAGISKFGNPVSSFFGKADDVVGKVDDTATMRRADELAKDIGARTQKGIVNNVEVDIPVQESVIGKVVGLGDTDATKLANRALMPKTPGFTPKQRVMNAEQVAERIKKLHGLVRQGKIEGDLSDLTTAARTVVNGLDSVGSDIGKMIDKAKGTLKLSDNILGTLDEAIESATAKRSPVTQILQNLKEDLGKDVSIVDAQAFKKIYQNEIGKFIKSGDAGTDQFKALVNATQELNDNIEKVVLKTAGKGLKEKKEIYGLFKSLADDITKSAQVEARSSPMPLVEQLGYLDALTDPKAFLKGKIGKELSEMNSRGGTWKRLINLYDKEAVKAFEKATKAPKNISTPKVPKGATEVKPKASKVKSLMDLTKGKGGFVNIGAIADDIVGKGGDDLVKEARKYKSADAFVKAKKTPPKEKIFLYRGMNQKFDPKFDLSKTDAPNGYSTWTDDLKLAEQYAGSNGFVYKVELPKNKLGKEIIDNDGERVLFFNNQKKAGLNNISGDEYLIYNFHDDYNPSLIKQTETESQLKQIYEQANKPRKIQ